MRIHGTLTKWNDDRGFGFVELPQTHEAIFVHISAFPKDGTRPRIGETISFEVRCGTDGRKRAEAVARPRGRSVTRDRTDASTERKRVPVAAGLAVVGLGIAGAVAYTSSTSSQRADIVGQPFRCDGRTHCSEMTSCAEATYFLENCPNTQVDGDNDGEPCEQQWCSN